MYYLDVVDLLQMSEDQAMASMLCLLSGWSLEAVSDLAPGFWRSARSLEEYLSFFDKRMLFAENTDCCEVQGSLRGRSGLQEPSNRRKYQLGKKDTRTGE